MNEKRNRHRPARKAYAKELKTILNEFPMFVGRVVPDRHGHVYIEHKSSLGVDTLLISGNLNGPATMHMGVWRAKYLGLHVHGVTLQEFPSIRAAINYALINGWVV